MPIPFIVNNFMEYYKKETQKAQAVKSRKNLLAARNKPHFVTLRSTSNSSETSEKNPNNELKSKEDQESYDQKLPLVPKLIIK